MFHVQSVVIWVAVPFLWLLLTLFIFLIYFCARCCCIKPGVKRRPRPVPCLRWSIAVFTVLSWWVPHVLSLLWDWDWVRLKRTTRHSVGQKCIANPEQLRTNTKTRSSSNGRNFWRIVLNNIKKLSYRRDSARYVKRPFEVTQGDPLLCQTTRHIWLPIITQQ